MPEPLDQSKAQVFETTWLQGVVEFGFEKTPDRGVILIYTLGNGHQFAIPLNGNLLALTQQAVSPVTVAGLDQLPSTGANGKNR